MIHYYDGRRTPVDFLVRAVLFVNERLPWKQTFTRDGSVRESYLKKNTGYELPKKLVEKYRITRYGEKDVYLLDSGRPGKTILYTHGGAYWYQPTSAHFSFLRALVDECGGRVIVPIYPKAPDADVDDVYAFITPVYTEVINKEGADNVILMGDSAGGGFTLGFAMEKAKQHSKVPHVVLLSPWLDISCTDRGGNVHDPWLRRDVLALNGKYYRGDASEKDTRVSPLYGTTEGIPLVTILSGTDDILSADSLEFEKRNINVDLWVYPRQPHAFEIYPLGSARGHAFSVITTACRYSE